jgi:hypothetical protein
VCNSKKEFMLQPYIFLRLPTPPNSHYSHTFSPACPPHQIKKKESSPFNRPPRAWRGSRCIALLILDLVARRWWVVRTTHRPLYPSKDPVPTVQEDGWDPGPVWICSKNLTPTGIRSPDRPARSQSLNRLSYPAHTPPNWFPLTFLHRNLAFKFYHTLYVKCE